MLLQTFSSLSVPAYRFYWIGSIFTTTAFQVQMFARGLLAYELGGSAASIGIVTLGSALPQLLLSMVGGTFADRVDRLRLLIFIQMIKAAIAVAITVMVLADVMTVPYLFAVGLFQGVIMAFNGPTRQAFIPEVVDERNLMNAIALNSVAQNLSRIGAPSLAAAIVGIAWVDIAGVYIFQAGLDVIALLFLFILPPLMPSRAAAQTLRSVRPPAGFRIVFGELRDGFRYIFNSQILVTLLLIGLVPTLLAQSHQQFFPVFAKDVFGNGVDRNAGAIGFMGTMSGVGALAGSLLVAILSDYKRRTLLQLGAGLGFGFFIAAFAVQNNYVAAVIMLMGVGFSSAFLWALNNTMLMVVADPAYHGRVISVNMLAFSLIAVGTFVMGYVIDWIGRTTLGPLELESVQLAYFVVGIFIVGFILVMTVLNPSYRRLEQSDLQDHSHTDPRGGQGMAEPAAS